MTLYKGNVLIDAINRRGGVLQIYKGATLVYTRKFDPVTFTENGTWVVPAGIRKIAVDCVAASGNGGGSSYTHPTFCTNVEHTQGFNTGNGYITISMA